MICEVQVMTDETLHCRHGMHELFKVFRAPDKYSLFRDMDKAEKVITDSTEVGLEWAARYGELDTVQYIVSEKAYNLNAPLYLSAESGHSDVVDYLLKAQADVNYTDPTTRNSALAIASQNGHAEVVEVLLRSRPDVDLSDNLGVTPLQYGTLHGFRDIVEMLLVARADIDKQRADVQLSPLQDAVQEGFADVAKVLLKARADVEMRDEEGCTALWLASTHGHRACVEVLLEAGADPNAADTFNQRPLNQAVLKGEQDVIELLIQSKADVNAMGQDGTPWEDAHAAEVLGNTSRGWILKALREAGAEGEEYE
mmetsp:Transcript_14177/g.26053  ORF Transcript_14177/g.26053 Transcript_14177/m.26053 type:complete len:312 (-) Transcript_14177:71-1006(-)